MKERNLRTNSKANTSGELSHKTHIGQVAVDVASRGVHERGQLRAALGDLHQAHGAHYVKLDGAIDALIEVDHGGAVKDDIQRAVQLLQCLLSFGQ